jgi:tRNA pseudouridine32 synthase/23S rRNA pseudouridine746 synthase
VVDGLLADDEGEINLPLIADWPNRPRQMVSPSLGKPSLTRWRVLQRDAELGRTRLALYPLTGRSHQLRVHLSAIGHAIVGDELYASPDVASASTRLLVHACALRLMHPAYGVPIAFDSDAPF